jgi:hypothetical protein
VLGDVAGLLGSASGVLVAHPGLELVAHLLLFRAAEGLAADRAVPGVLVAVVVVLVVTGQVVQLPAPSNDRRM